MKNLSREFFAKHGAQGGKAKGASKRRGSSEYYKRLAKKGAQVRKDKARDAPEKP